MKRTDSKKNVFRVFLFIFKIPFERLLEPKINGFSEFGRSSIDYNYPT